MDSTVYSILVTLIALVSFIFASVRLGFFKKDELFGRLPFIFGGLLVIIALIWQSVATTAVYTEWFLESVYPILAIVQFILIGLGLILSAVGLVLYADYFQTQKDDLKAKERQYDLLRKLQIDAKNPYHVTELLSLSLKQIVSNMDETLGAVFLVNRSRRQIVLIDTAGLTKQETANLEHYPSGENLITRAIDNNEPMISDFFQFVNRQGEKETSRFKSSLVLPLSSGNETIGGIILFSEKGGYFDTTQIRLLMPITEWLAEKVRSTKLSRDYNNLIEKQQEFETAIADKSNRLLRASTALNSPETVSAFCKSLVGLCGSRSAHLIGLKGGGLTFFGGSADLSDLSENYKTALIESLDKHKALIINQEATADSGRNYIARSTLIFPIKDEQETNAILLIADGGPIPAGDEELKTLELFSSMAKLALKQEQYQNNDLTRRKGIDRVLGLLRFDRTLDFENEPNYLLKQLSEVLPDNTSGLTFVKEADGSFRSTNGLRTGGVDLSEFEIYRDEAVFGRINKSAQPEILYGRKKVDQLLREFDDANQNLFFRLMGEKGISDFCAVLPIIRVDRIVGINLIFIYNVSEISKDEWTRLLTLASGLYSLRLTIQQLNLDKARPVTYHTSQAQNIGEVLNKLNNHLNAIVGNAELANWHQDLSDEIKAHFESILNEAESAAQYLRETPIERLSVVDRGKVDKPKGNLNDIIVDVLDQSFISDNIYMLGNRPREINKAFEAVGPLSIDDTKLLALFEESINRFAAFADDEDAITIATYTKDGYLYLDISRHHKNFPPVAKVADFGDYNKTADVFVFRPVDTFLKHIAGINCYYAFDKISADPSYLSFKFPLAGITSPAATIRKQPKILVVDDQVVILDLIRAMGKSSGFEIKTAQNGSEGLQMALSEKFDIILTDLAMPGLSGLELAREVKKKYAHIPIILITGWEVNLDKAQLEVAGILEVLYKPFRLEQLTDIINNIVNSQLS